MTLLVCVDDGTLGCVSCETTEEGSQQDPVRSGAHSSHGFLVMSLTGLGLTQAFLFNCFVLDTDRLLTPGCFSAPDRNPVFFLCVFCCEHDQTASIRLYSVTEIAGIYCLENLAEKHTGL